MTASALLGLFFAPANAGKSLDEIQEEQTWRDGSHRPLRAVTYRG